MSTIRKGIEVFLKSRLSWSPYLIPKWSPDLESQIMVHPGLHETEERQWSDGEQVWSHHRWPYKAGVSPYYNDKKLTYDPAAHVHRIGSTWWNWKTKQSIAVAFDIDVDEEHAPSTNTVSKTQLQSIISKLKELPYVTLVHSTGGVGIHAYVFFKEDDLPTANNHNEHTQVALATLDKMSEDADYDFRKHIDAKGLIFWFWSDTSPEDHPGYSLIHEATQQIGASDIDLKTSLLQTNKRAYVKGFNDDGSEAESETINNGYKIYPLDDVHKSILLELKQSGYTFIWNAEFNMAHTHTCALKELYEKRKAEGRPLKGMFDTISKGTEPSKPNCFITPRPDGVFQVRRFGNGVIEHASWNSGSNTWCFYNYATPVIEILSKFASKYDGKTMLFEAGELEAGLKAMGHTLGESHIQGPVEVLRQKDGTFVATAKCEGVYPGWTPTKGGQKKVLPVVYKNEDRNRIILEEVDSLVRVLFTVDRVNIGTLIFTESGWLPYNQTIVTNTLKQKFGKEANYVQDLISKNPWYIANIPFAPEYPSASDMPSRIKYPSDRVWNFDSIQLAFEPASEPGPHPHWDMIYDHLGSSLDSVVASTPWCQEWGLESGGDYLRYWMAAVIQDPFSPLPYLFFYGDQNTGKTIFQESAALLFTRGAVKSAGSALTNSSGFNAEIAKTIIGFIEEKDLSSIRDTAYARMKEWVTSLTFSVHMKGLTPFEQPNILKMVQMANKPTAIAIESDDTRITAFAVNSITNIIPRKAMDKFLWEEAPFFIRTLISIYLPEPIDRLRIPMLASKDKEDLEAINREPWEEFAAGALINCPGEVIKFSDFYDKYLQFCTMHATIPMGSRTLLQVVKSKSNKYVTGTYHNKQTYIANVTFDSNAIGGTPLVLNEKGRLVKCI